MNDPPLCDCGHAFSVNPTWWHLDGCAYVRWFASRGELDDWRGRGPDGETLDDYETVEEA